MTWEDALLLVEAARWAPSAGNSQPWMFRPLLRGTEEHQLLVPSLAGSSRLWAANASVLILNLRRRFVDGSTIEYSEFAEYDLGQPVAHMTFQAQSMGLACRQFRAFDHARVTRDFEVPEEWDLMTMTAVGRPADGPPLTRDRRSLSDVLASDLRRRVTRARPTSS
jgi:nitroreductase